MYARACSDMKSGECVGKFGVTSVLDLDMFTKIYMTRLSAPFFEAVSIYRVIYKTLAVKIASLGNKYMGKEVICVCGSQNAI